MNDYPEVTRMENQEMGGWTGYVHTQYRAGHLQGKEGDTGASE